MNQTPTLVALIGEIDALVKERDELLKQVEAYREVRDDNRKKLTEREVREIRNLANVSRMTQREIADCYDVNPGTVSRIVRGIYHK